MSVKAKWVILLGAAIIWLLAQPLVGQDASQLNFEEKGFLLNGGTSMSLSPDRCDGEGNLYREWVDQKGHPLPVTKISPEGQIMATFSLDSVPDEDIRKDGYRFYTINQHGNLYGLSPAGDMRDPKIFVVRFKPDGTFEGATELKSPESVLPFHLAVFPRGSFSYQE
jgi:hypothetical protein